MRVPKREDVAQELSETEAFAQASRIYKDWVTRNTPPGSAELVSTVEHEIFKPGMILQLGGLSLMGGKNVGEPEAVPFSFACFVVDHLLWGWFTSVIGHPRVALTLSRAAVEASIFEIAAAQDLGRFKSKWNTPSGTGGTVLKDLKNLPKDFQRLLTELWNGTVAFGHASAMPVMPSYTRFRDGTEFRTGISFAGQYAGPLDARQLQGICTTFGLASIAGVEAMQIAIRPHMTQTQEWDGNTENFAIA